MALSQYHLSLILPANSSTRPCPLLISEHKYFPRVSICCFPGQITRARKLLKHVPWTSWNRLDPIHPIVGGQNCEHCQNIRPVFAQNIHSQEYFLRKLLQAHWALNLIIIRLKQCLLSRMLFKHLPPIKQPQSDFYGRLYELYFPIKKKKKKKTHVRI